MVKEIIYQTCNWWVDLGTLYSCTTMVNFLHQIFGGIFRTYSLKDNLFIVYNFTSVWDQRIHYMKDRLWKMDCPLVLAACLKLGQGDYVCNLHELIKNASVRER